MRFEFEQDERGRILAAYIRVTEEPVARTVEIRRGKVVVDEDSAGSLVGVEFIAPDRIGEQLAAVALRYDLPELPTNLERLMASC